MSTTIAETVTLSKPKSMHSRSIHGADSSPVIELAELPSGRSILEENEDQSAPMRRSSFKPRTWEHIQFLTLCWALLLAGYNDGSTGPLLPKIRQVYDVRVQSFPVALSQLIVRSVSQVGFVRTSLIPTHICIQ